tara:strand:- start:332 stop:607 length:276 start_codon:yes stop_codon:yes gene_type:complete
MIQKCSVAVFGKYFRHYQVKVGMHTARDQMARLARTAGRPLPRSLAKHLSGQVEAQEILADSGRPGNQQGVMLVVTAKQFFAASDQPRKIR